GSDLLEWQGLMATDTLPTALIQLANLPTTARGMFHAEPSPGPPAQVQRAAGDETMSVDWGDRQPRRGSWARCGQHRSPHAGTSCGWAAPPGSPPPTPSPSCPRRLRSPRMEATYRRILL